MAQKAKFLFDYSFDEHHGQEAAAAAAAKQAHLQAELEAAFAKGREAGLAEAAAGAAQRAADALNAMTERLARIERMRVEIEQSTTRSAVGVALAALRRILPTVERRVALPEIEAVLADCLHRVLDEPRVVFRVPDDLLDALRERVDEVGRRAGFHGKVVLLADGDLGVSDCRIEWADGGAERNVERIWKDVEDLVGRTLHEPTEPMTAAAEPAAATAN
jgi:flagellar assembly protein FliH